MYIREISLVMLRNERRLDTEEKSRQREEDR